MNPPFIISLAAPGMSPLHRAGLGGLAATLRSMERAYKSGKLSEDTLPGGSISWRVLPSHIELHIPEPTGALKYLKLLFEYAFRVRDKLIDLPGALVTPVPQAIRAEHQLGLTLTFLQFGPHRGLGASSFKEIDPDGEGKDIVTFELDPCERFVHQSGWRDLVDSKGRLKTVLVATPSCFNPGAIVRHNQYSAATEIREPITHVLSACFAIVGCLSLPINRGVGVLLIPPVRDLNEFARLRPQMTPTSLRDCRIAGTADAALQTSARLLAVGTLDRTYGEQMLVMRLRPTQWNKKQKARTDVLNIYSSDNKMVRRFDSAMRHLPRHYTANPQLSEHKVTREGKDIKVKHAEQIWIDSVVRPVIATNLATRRHWCHNFWTLCADRKSREALKYEKKGLQAMAKDLTIAEPEQIDRERIFIRAIHRAIYMARGKIYADTMGKEAAKRKQQPSSSVFKRWESLNTELRVRLLQAKTRMLIQAAISKLLARTGVVKELRDQQARDFVHQFVFHTKPETARNLALYAISCYTKPEDKPDLPGDTDTDDPTDLLTHEETNV